METAAQVAETMSPRECLSCDDGPDKGPGDEDMRGVRRTKHQVIGRTLVFATMVSLLGCDPGVTVRQINSSVVSEDAARLPITEVLIKVESTHQLIGERWYRPLVTVTNPSDIPVTITSVELIACSQTFKNQDTAAKDYPLTVPSHTAVPLSAHFRFSEGVNVAKAFKNPGELRIHYSSQQGAGIVRVAVALGPLNAK